MAAQEVKYGCAVSSCLFCALTCEQQFGCVTFHGEKKNPCVRYKFESISLLSHGYYRVLLFFVCFTTSGTIPCVLLFII